MEGLTGCRWCGPPPGRVVAPLSGRVTASGASYAASSRGCSSSPTEKLGLPNFTIVGLTDRAIQEARERVRASIRNAGFEFPSRRLTVNLAPAEAPKDGTGFDLADALACMGRTVCASMPPCVRPLDLRSLAAYHRRPQWSCR
jgi:Subunit ChlI of Mg-chelatase